MPGKSDRSPNGNETDMTNKMQVLPYESSFRFYQTKPRLAVSAPGYGTAATGDGRWLLVAMQSTSQVAVVDLQTLQVARTIDAPPTPHEILIPPGNDIAYVSCTKSGKIAAISLSDQSIENLSMLEIELTD